MRTNKGITQEQLKKVIHYNPDTGIFTWISKVSYKINVGQKAGCVDGRNYVNIFIKKIKYRAHRLAWLYITGKWPDHIDHINGIRNDNRLINLRNVDKYENSKNLCLDKRNKLGITGVYSIKGSYRARINSNNKSYSLGCFSDFFEACCARKSAEIKYKFHENHGRKI